MSKHLFLELLPATTSTSLLQMQAADNGNSYCHTSGLGPR